MKKTQLRQAILKQPECGEPPGSKYTAEKKSGFFPLGDAHLRELYLRGLFRNIVSVLSRTHTMDVSTYFQSFDDAVDESRETDSVENLFDASINYGNRDRGDLNTDLFVFLLGTSNVELLSETLKNTMKSEKQGAYSYHELALAHCLLCVFQTILFGKHDRHADAITTSMAMGNLIKPLDCLATKVMSTYEFGQIASLNERRLQAEFPSDLQVLHDEIAKSREVNSRSSRLATLDQYCVVLLKAYLLIVCAGLTQIQPFELFLDGKR